MGLENPLHIAILALVLFIVFGARRFPGMARDLGTGLREFGQGITGAGAPRASADHPATTADAPAAPQAAMEPVSSAVPLD